VAKANGITDLMADMTGREIKLHKP